MVVIIIMTISAVCTVAASNFMVSYVRYQMAECKINSIVRKAERGYVYDLKNGYMRFWTDELRAQHSNAVENREQLSRSNEICRWINMKQKQESKISAATIFSLTALCIGIYLFYASFIALAKKVLDIHEFNTNPLYYNSWNWKKKYQYYAEKKEEIRRRKEAMEWIRGLN